MIEKSWVCYILIRMKTTKEAAKLLGYANDAVIRLMIKQKRLKAEKFGHVWVVPESEIKRLSKVRAK